jgi:hypothetical protein
MAGVSDLAELRRITQGPDRSAQTFLLIGSWDAFDSAFSENEGGSQLNRSGSYCGKAQPLGFI